MAAIIFMLSIFSSTAVQTQVAGGTDQTFFIVGWARQRPCPRGSNFNDWYI